MSEFDISGKSSMSPIELRAQEALEAQLKLTKELIEKALGDHPHFTDDCGEYLRAALDLSTQLMLGRENGVEGLISILAGFGDSDGTSYGLEQFACDGLSEEVEDLVNNAHEELNKYDADFLKQFIGDK